MPKINDQSKFIEELLIYQNNELGLMKENTVTTYLTHSTNFVRWCKGEFDLGERNRNKK